MNGPRIGWKPALLTFLVVTFSSAVASVEAEPPPNPIDEPVEPPAMLVPAIPQDELADGTTCFACHEIESDFMRNPHARTWDDTDKDWSEKGCQTCHGPAQAHIDGGGDVEQVFRFGEASAQEISDRCLDCHLKQDKSQVNFLRNEHGLNSVGCTSCHTVHKPKVEEKLLRGNSPALCYDCHNEVRAQFNKPFRHKIHEGFMDCSSCHNQHGGFSRRQLTTSMGNYAPCLDCHSDKQGPFVFEHAPVRVEGCSVCHEPHGSSNPRLLKRAEQRFLCLDCHSDTVGVPGPATPDFHNLVSAGWQNCTTCHTEIHGSNLSPVFFVD